MSAAYLTFSYYYTYSISLTLYFTDTLHCFPYPKIQFYNNNEHIISLPYEALNTLNFCYGEIISHLANSIILIKIINILLNTLCYSHDYFIEIEEMCKKRLLLENKCVREREREKGAKKRTKRGHI